MIIDSLSLYTPPAPLGTSVPDATKTGQPAGYFHAVLSGVMLTAAFPPAKMEWMAWFALIPLIGAAAKAPPSTAFRLGLVTGFAHYLTLIYWIVLVLGYYGGLPIYLSAGILLLFCLYLSLFPALFAAMTSACRGSFFTTFFIAALWTVLEFARANLLTGFPWCLLGYSQYRNLALIQISDLVGVYGVSFLIVLCNAVIYTLFRNRSYCAKGSLKWELILALILLVLVPFYGRTRLKEVDIANTKAPPLPAAIVQGNVDQSVKWEPEYQEKTVEIYETLTRAAAVHGPRLVVWPETAMPFDFQTTSEFSIRVARVAQSAHADLLFGSPAFVRENGVVRYFNRAYGLTPQGTQAGYYDKVHLVPFGEYVPLKRFLPFIQRLVQAAGDFTPGEEIAPLDLSSSTAGVLICFEIIFPELSRTRAKDGATLLINLTNDAWFGLTSAPHQHLAMAVFRAVETRRPLIRAANTGISAMIGPTGEIITSGALFEEEVLVGTVRPHGPETGFYVRHGDLFPMALLVISLVKIFFIMCYAKKFKIR